MAYAIAHPQSSARNPLNHKTTTKADQPRNIKHPRETPIQHMYTYLAYIVIVNQNYCTQVISLGQTLMFLMGYIKDHNTRILT